MATQYFRIYICFYVLLFFLYSTLVNGYKDNYKYYLSTDKVEKTHYTLNLLDREKRGTEEVFNSTKKKSDLEDKTKTYKKATSFDVKIDSVSGESVSVKPKTAGKSKKELVGHANPKNGTENVTIHTAEFENGHLNSNIGAVHNHTVNDSSQEISGEVNSTTPTTTVPSTTTTTYRPYTKASGPVLKNITAVLPDDADIQFSKFFEDEISNNTLVQNNITQMKQDHHLYYNSSFHVDPSVGQHYWVNLDSNPNVKVNYMLSQSHRRAATVMLSFDFPFYGHTIRNITIATGGFLYTGDYVHSWLAATQYIAPLMANFDTSLTNNSFVKYLDNGTAFTVQWEKVVLQDRPDSGDFTFQCTLFKNGNIVFVYQHVAVVIKDIEDNQHPVKVGLSDAYIIDKTIFFVRRKTIYEYHRVQFKREEIKNWTAIVLNALDTCLDMKDCESCVTEVPGFQCNWCAGRCSNGMDRQRQDWLSRNCETHYYKTVEECHAPDSSVHPDSTLDSLMHRTDQNNSQDSGNVNISIAGLLGILFLTVLMIGSGLWINYAYRNPHTASGQFLIRYRPSQWSWRRGEARYTAATIHM